MQTTNMQCSANFWKFFTHRNERSTFRFRLLLYRSTRPTFHQRRNRLNKL